MGIKVGYEWYLNSIIEQYQEALSKDANFKSLTGINFLFSCSYQNSYYPNEEAFELGMKLLILASKEGKKYAFSQGSDKFTSENKYGKGLDTAKVLQIYQVGVENGDKYSHYNLRKYFLFHR